MTDPAKARPPSAARRASSRRKHADELLDQALADTFPASDPVAALQPAPDIQPDEDPDIQRDEDEGGDKA
jgi:hypothetical protein